MCGTLYTEQVSEVQCRLSGGGNTRYYSRALGEDFRGLSEVEAELCIAPAELWNADASSLQVCRNHWMCITVYDIPRVQNEATEWSVIPVICRLQGAHGCHPDVMLAFETSVPI